MHGMCTFKVTSNYCTRTEQGLTQLASRNSLKRDVASSIVADSSLARIVAYHGNVLSSFFGSSALTSSVFPVFSVSSTLVSVDSSFFSSVDSSFSYIPWGLHEANILNGDARSTFEVGVHGGSATFSATASGSCTLETSRSSHVGVFSGSCFLNLPMKFLACAHRFHLDGDDFSVSSFLTVAMVASSSSAGDFSWGSDVEGAAAAVVSSAGFSASGAASVDLAEAADAVLLGS
mmetsp:Transcript_22365/g.38381  ORF Transcript_22365/g.38381 Transcript_22365/m.38381 type:complete len:233 (-) Transcript_22365:380-1078(-)